ncbi:protein of unknown function [Candidatus Methylacidiphilum fumarolicum]|uniref:Uncharacterized protein n=1 Tax=Candidatus Methylacidiphilum fumarolicum TaxID=591154 RepID=A0ABM9ICS1_9BACT|nr:protein of unknown function [Candidatus Methylacidiphilum fumarolicum]
MELLADPKKEKLLKKENPQKKPPKLKRSHLQKARINDHPFTHNPLRLSENRLCCVVEPH